MVAPLVRKARLLVLLALAVLVAAPTSAQLSGLSARASAAGPTLPDGFYLEDAVDARFVLPVAVAFAPGGRMFVVEKRGLVWVVQDGRLQDEPFVDLRDEVLDQHDRGLLGIAVDPAFAENRRVYLSYTVDHEETADRQRLDAFARVTRYAGHADNPNVADPGSRRVLIGETFATGIPSCYRSHTIGTLAFGADGTLVVGTGDGAHFGRVDAGGEYDECFGEGRLDPSEDVGAFRSRRVESLAGKLLRIDPETGRGLPSNPFWAGDPDANASKVWALGLRNPFRFALDAASGAVDPAAGRPGRVYVGDVGWAVWEELNVAEGGENFGWPCFEGRDPHGAFQSVSPPTDGCDGPAAGALTDAPYVWHHERGARSDPSDRTGRAVVAGAVYGGTKYPSFYRGALFYGDYARRWAAVSRLDGDGRPVQERLFAPDLGPVVGYAYDPASEYLHLVNIASGRVLRLRHTGEAANAPPVARASAAPGQGGVGLRVQLSPAGSFDPDGDALRYAWAFGDGATSDVRAPVHTYAAPGTYEAVLTVSDGSLSATASATVTVRAGSAPTVRITAPTAATRGATGRSVRLAAEVRDPDQSDASLFVRWTVTQVHDDHVHPTIFSGADAETSFVVPEHGLPGEQVYYRITAEVRDATGLTASDEVALFLGDDPGEADVTAEGTVVASSAPQGGRGAAGLGALSDGVTPAPGAADAGRQVAVVGDGAGEAWVGVLFVGPKRFSRVAFQEGLHAPDGGWFERPPRVQVLDGRAWRDVVDLTVSPAYRADDGRGFDTYELAFAPAEGSGVRVVGPGGGSGRFVSAAELRAFEVTGPTGDGAGGDGDGGNLPAEWTATDVGDPAGAGSASAAGGTISVTGGGDVWNQADRFHFVHQALDGDGVLVARLAALSPGTEWFKGGLMVRSGLEPGAAHGSILTSNIGTHLQARRAADGPSTAHGDDWGRLAPTWLRLERAGTTVTGSVSDDGVAWRALGSVDVPGLGDGSALIGLAVSAADFGDGATATAQFAGVALQAGAPEGWTSTDIGAPAGAGSFAEADGAFVVRGGGDIWSVADRFHLAHRLLPADGAVEARVSVPRGPNDWSKAGLMVRRSAAPDAPHAWFGFSRIGLHLQHRPTAGGPSSTPLDDWGARAAEWLRVERRGPRVAAFRSDDGRAWRPFQSVEVPGLGDGPALVGLAVSAADFGDGVVAEGRFEDVRVVEAGAVVGGGAPAALQMDTQAVEAAPFAIDAVYPNPLRGRAAVRAALPADAELTVALFDVLGRRVASETLFAAAGVVELALDLRGVPAGAYLLRLTDGATSEERTRAVTVVR